MGNGVEGVSEVVIACFHLRDAVVFDRMKDGPSHNERLRVFVCLPIRSFRGGVLSPEAVHVVVRSLGFGLSRG